MTTRLRMMLIIVVDVSTGGPFLFDEITTYFWVGGWELGV